MSTMGWLSRLVLGSAESERVVAAQQKFTKTLDEHKFEPDTMRAELQRILQDVEQKTEALSLPPPPAEEHESSRHEPANRRTKVRIG